MNHKYNKLVITGCFILLFLFPIISNAQEHEGKHESEEVEGTFNGPMLIDNQTVDVVEKNELEFSFMQRFGNIKNDVDMFGLFSPENLRFGIDYGLIKNVSIGIGATKAKSIFDLNAKVVLFKQNTLSMPVTISFFGEASRSGMSENNFINQDGEYNSMNRMSYFSELMIARKFNDQFSLQGALTYSYFNLIEETYSNSNLGVSILGRYMFHKHVALIGDYDLPLTNNNLPKQNMGIGLEFMGKSNSLQLFVSSRNTIVNSEYRVCNPNDFKKGELLFGFNISHKWGLKN